MRRTRSITISKPAVGENRDAGKTFLVTEVDAVEAEEWGLRAMMALGTGGIQVPPELVSAGLLGIVLVGYQAFMGAREDAVIPLWREMLPKCVQLKHSDGGASGQQVVQPWHSSLVEEVSTLLLLRQTVMELHTGFTMAELASRFASMNSAMNKNAISSPTPDGQLQAE